MRSSLLLVTFLVAAFATPPSAGQEEQYCFGQDQYEFTVGKVDVWEYEADFELTITKVGFWMECTETVYVSMVPHDNKLPATPGDDFVVRYYAVKFTNQQTEANITVTVVDDDIVEADEWFTLRLDGPAGRPEAVADQDDVDVRILSDQGGFRFAQATYDATGTAGTLPVRVDRVGENDTAVSVRLAYTQAGIGGPSSAGALDVAFAADARAAEVAVPFIRDDAHAPVVEMRLEAPAPSPHTFLSDPSFARLLLPTDEPVDDPAIVRVEQPLYRIGEADGGVRIDVLRTGNLTRAFNVSYEITPGTAAATDFVGASGVLHFAASDRRKVVVVNIIDDRIEEGAETVWFRLHDVTAGAVIGSPAGADVLILDNDAAPTPTAEESPASALGFLLLALACLASWRRGHRVK